MDGMAEGDLAREKRDSIAVFNFFCSFEVHNSDAFGGVSERKVWPRSGSVGFERFA